MSQRQRICKNESSRISAGYIGCGKQFQLEITPQQIAGVTYGPVKTAIPCP